MNPEEPEIKPFDEVVLRDEAHENLVRKASSGNITAIQQLKKMDEAMAFKDVISKVFELDETE